MKKFIILFLCLLFFSGCTKNKSNSLAPENTEWIKYKNAKYNFSLEIPKSWTIKEFINYTTFNSPKNEEYKKTIKPEGLRSSNYIENVTVNYYEKLEDFGMGSGNLEEILKKNSYLKDLKNINFADSQAWESIMTGDQINGYNIFFMHNNHLYQLGITNILSKQNLDDVDKKIIQSFKFDQ